MKNRILTIASVLFCSFATFAQSQKEELGLKIKEDLSFIYGTFVNQCVTLNVNPVIMDVMVANEKFPKGVSGLSAMGNALMHTYDYMFDTKFKERCDPHEKLSKSTKLDCEAEIITLKNKLNVTVNASKIKYTDTSYKLMMGYLSAVDSFLGSGSGVYGFNRGWRPRTKELHIIIELSEAAKDIKVTWSPDGKTATVVGTAYFEVDEWDRKIGKGLERGGNK